MRSTMRSDMRTSAILSIVILASCAACARAQSLNQQVQCAARAKRAYQEFQTDWRNSPVKSNYPATTKPLQHKAK